jgi:putative membrane protein
MQAKELRTMMGWYDDGVGWGGWIVMTVAMVAFWALVVFAVLALFRGTQRSGETSPGRQDANRILDERFARGEIDEDEYHARSGVLRTSAH